MPTRSIEAELLHRRSQRFVSRSTPSMTSPTAGSASPRSPASPSTPTPATATYPTAATASGSGGLELAILTALDRGFRRVVLLLTPTAEETERRIAAFEALRNGLRRQDLHAYIFGSSRTGTVLPCSDLDVCVRRRELDHPCLQNPQRPSDYILMPNSTLADLKGRLSGDGGGGDSDDEGSSNNHHGRNARGGGNGGNGGIRASQSLLSSGPRRRGMKVGSEFQDVLRYVNNRSAGFRNIFPITRSRVPIIKMVHGATGVPIDVTFTADGLLTSRLLYEEFYRVQVLFDRSLFKAGFARAEIPTRALIVLLKLVFSGARMDDPAVGGIGSFVCSMLVLWYLRQALAKLEKQHGFDSTSATTKGGAANSENPPTWWMKGRAGPAADVSSAKKKLSGRRRDRDEDLEWDEGSAATPAPPARARLPQLGLGALFAGLLRYYGSEFDAARTGVDCSRWMTFGKPPVAQLTLLNPIDPSTNAAAAASRYCRDAVPLIAQSYRSILAAAHTDAKRAADVGGASSPVAPANSAVVGTYAQVIRRVVPGLAERWPDPSALDSAAHREALRHAAGVDEAGFYYGLLL